MKHAGGGTRSRRIKHCFGTVAQARPSVLSKDWREDEKIFLNITEEATFKQPEKLARFIRAEEKKAVLP